VKYLDSVALAKLGRMRFDLSRRTADGSGSGRHRSLSRGFSHEFSQHRAYAPGDEIKRLDWKLYARQDRFFVREFHDETLLSAHVLLDASGSMGFGAGGAKWEQACRLAMGMAYLVIASGDAAGLSVFNDQPGDYLPPRSALSHLELMDGALAKLAPGRTTDLPRALQRTAARLKRRSLVILISDLYGDAEANLASLKALRSRKHELVVLHVVDARERDFDYEGPTVFESLEDSARTYCDATTIAELYRAEFAHMQRLYQTACSRSEIAYGVFPTDRAWDESLARFLGAWS
jgi:uncharacterized protein (DUF58 family)